MLKSLIFKIKNERVYNIKANADGIGVKCNIKIPQANLLFLYVQSLYT